MAKLCKSISDSSGKAWAKSWYNFIGNDYEIRRWNVSVQLRGSPLVFGNPLRPIHNLSTCSSSPAAREPISVAIPFDHLRRKGTKMQKAKCWSW
jgi:hypothetical protein